MIQNNVKRVPFTRSFKLLILGQMISILGSALLRFGLSLYALDLTGRADIYGTLYAMSSIPLLLSPIGGAIADRFNRRNLFVLYDFGGGFVVLGFILLLAAGDAPVVVIGIVMVLLSLISAMYQPAVQASIPQLVQESQLEQANGMVNGIGALAQMAAPVLGGILYGVLGLHTLMIGSGIAFLLSALMQLFIKIPFVKREQKGNIVAMLAADMKAGMAYVVQRRPILKAMVLAALLNFILTPFFVVGGPIILRVTMQSSDTLYGVGMGIVECSTILGALTIGFFARKMQMSTLYRWLLVIAAWLLPMSLSLTPWMLGLGYYPAYMLFMASIVPIAMALTMISIFVLTRVQKQTPNELLGKVMAIIMAVAQIAAPVGQIVYGELFEMFSLQVYIPALLMFAALLLTAWLTKRFYQNQKGEEEQDARNDVEKRYRKE
ncbi:MFS transporter [Paenibacillus algorifonticola]|uniref:MFS transporter n=1 Tax=Paenibacillus algorifonticola TaxID=684063 RepID=UPI003D2A9392